MQTEHTFALATDEAIIQTKVSTHRQNGVMTGMTLDMEIQKYDADMSLNKLG